MTLHTIDLVMTIAQRMVEAGAEIGRVEESVSRMCAAYDCDTEVYVTSSHMTITFRSQEELCTQSRRTGDSSLNIEKIHRLNDLVRMVSATAPADEKIEQELEQIEKAPHYPFWLYLFACAMIGSTFCIFFGGHNPWEAVFAAIIGCGVGGAGKGLEVFRPNKILSRFLSSFLGSVSAMIVLRLGWVDTVDNIVIGNIMVLIPGIGITNALRDLFIGDTTTGLYRFVEAILLALAIALGFWVAAYIFGGIV